MTTVHVEVDVTVDATATVQARAKHPMSKVGTKEFETKLLGLIQMGNHVSVKVLAQVIGASYLTVMKQLYYWAWTKQHLHIICRVNWKWNRVHEVPTRYIVLFTAHGQVGHPEVTDEWLDARFRKAVTTEITRQAAKGNSSKVVELANFAGEYFDDTL